MTEYNCQYPLPLHENKMAELRKMNPPDFAIIGAPKCGTTALYTYLKERPDVFMPDLKEPHFFASDFGNYRRIQEWESYLEMFAAAPPGAILGEASVWYLFSEIAVPAIVEANPEVRIIVMLRDPVDMVQALHGQLVYALDEDEPDFERAWALQDARAAGRNIPRHCREPKHLQYRQVGCFAHQIERIYRHLSAQHVLILIFEEFARDTADAYREVLRFLDLPDCGRQTFERVNASHARRAPKLAHGIRDLLVLLGPAYTPAKRAFNAFGLRPGRALRQWNYRPQLRTPLTPRLRAELVAAFEDDVARLETLLERPLDVWRTGQSENRRRVL